MCGNEIAHSSPLPIRKPAGGLQPVRFKNNKHNNNNNNDSNSNDTNNVKKCYCCHYYYC